MTTKAVDPPMAAHALDDSEKIAIREAVEGDNEALLELTRLTPMADSGLPGSFCTN
jgi:hypothetical protein